MTPFQKESKLQVVLKLKELDRRDWNKDWPDAQREAPKICACGKRLEKCKVKYERLIKPCKEFPSGLYSTSSFEHRIDCSCGIIYIWSYPNVWKRTHRISELHMYMEESGNLLRPKQI